MLLLNHIKTSIIFMGFGLAIVLMFSPTCIAVAGDNRDAWVTAEGTAPIIDGDVKAAKDLATKLAHQEAIRRSMCQNITMESLTVNLRLAGSLAGSIPHCRIIGSKILGDKRGNLFAHTKREQVALSYTVKIRADVLDAKTKADPKFKLEAQLNNARFNEGDEMVVRIVPTMPIYCYIYVILEDGQMIQLMPNGLGAHKRIGTGKTLMFPNADEKDRGIMLKTQLPRGKSITTEAIYVVALKASVKSVSKNMEALVLHPHEGEAGYFEQLVAKIATIPAGQRSEKILPYQIVKRKP